MKTVQICVGKFHHFDLTRELTAKGAEALIYTGYPRWKLRQERLPASAIATFPWLQTLRMALFRVGLRNAWLDREIAYWCSVSLSRHVARHLRECDALVALSGCGLEAGRVQKSRGGLWICDRGSSHIRYQEKILTEEYSRWGLKFTGIRPAAIIREELEYAEADLITVPSEFAYRSFVESGVPTAKLRKIPYGVDLSRFYQVGRPDEEEFRVLFVGQVCLRKGIPYLLEAFRRLRYPKKKLILIGMVHPEIARFLAAAGDNIQLLGARPLDELKEWMSRSHVMVLPSIEEGLALVQAMAMACGCPVIASDHTGAHDLFVHGEHGFITKIRDTEAIHHHLDVLAQNKQLRARLAEAALARVKSIGGWQQYGQLYMEMLKSSIPSGSIRE